MTKYDSEKRLKDRLTITLPPTLLADIDATIDGSDIRNRSHAIEFLIRKSLSPRVRTAVILAGGTKHKKSPLLLSFAEETLIHITIRHLHSYGINKIIIIGNNTIEDVKKSISSLPHGIELIWKSEIHPLGTAGSLISIADELQGDHSFLVLHGDILTTINLADFMAFHARERSIATIAVKPRDSELRYGQALLQGNRITKFLEHGQQGISIVNTGVYIFEKEIFSFIPKKTFATLEHTIFPALASQNELSAFLFQGVWFDVSSPGEYKKASLRWRLEHI